MTQKRPSLPPSIPRAEKRTLGRTPGPSTPLHIRALGVFVDERLKDYVRDRAGRKLGKFAFHVERVSVRFMDVNGPKGGVDTSCRIKATMSAAPSVVVEQRAADPRQGFDAAIDALERAVRKTLGRKDYSAASARSAKAVRNRRSPVDREALGPAIPPPPDGSLIGKRVGRRRDNLLAAAARPEKTRRDLPVDTAEPGRSATDRRVGRGSTAARNTKLRTSGMSAALEDSARSRPSRKSTRGSSNRAKSGTELQRRATRRTSSPKARADRAAARGEGSRGGRAGAGGGEPPQSP